MNGSILDTNVITKLLDKDPDIWIAACARVHNLSVATFDHHFSEISQINLVKV